jgi:hypothetical protein
MQTKYWYLFYNGDFDAMRWDNEVLRFESEAEGRSFAEIFGLENYRVDQVDLDGLGMSYKDIPAWQFKEEIINRIENRMNM